MSEWQFPHQNGIGIIEIELTPDPCTKISPLDVYYFREDVTVRQVLAQLAVYLQKVQRGEDMVDPRRDNVVEWDRFYSAATALVETRKAESSQVPVKPDKDAPLDQWFDYYHACLRAKRRYTLKELAADVSLDYGYIRQKHSEYKAEHAD
jgi:hypothetical protein